MVLLIMSRRAPDLYVHVGGTHVHHLNYGIFLLAGVGAYLLMGEPGRRGRSAATLAYGVGLALTFDEFGMWLHLGGSYWQRASFDAVVVVAASLALIACAPSLRRFGPRQWTVTTILAVAVGAFCVLLAGSLKYGERRLGPALEQLERSAPP